MKIEFKIATLIYDRQHHKEPGDENIWKKVSETENISPIKNNIRKQIYICGSRD